MPLLDFFVFSARILCDIGSIAKLMNFKHFLFCYFAILVTNSIVNYLFHRISLLNCPTICTQSAFQHFDYLILLFLSASFYIMVNAEEFFCFGNSCIGHQSGLLFLPISHGIGFFLFNWQTSSFFDISSKFKFPNRQF